CRMAAMAGRAGPARTPTSGTDMRYTVKAMRGDAVVDLELEAPDVTAAREEASRQGYDVLLLREPVLSMRLAQPVGFPVSIFTEQLLALLNAGLNIVEALQALVRKEPNLNRRRVVEQL